MADRRVEIEDDLIFRASDLSMTSRQFNAMKYGGKKSKALYKKFDGMGRGDVKKSLLSCCVKMLFEVCFICYVSGIDDFKMKQIVDKATAEGIKYNMGIH